MLFTEYTISIGLNDKDTLAPVMDFESARREIAGRLAQIRVGATITKGVGVYEHEDGRVVIEDTAIVQVVDFNGRFKKNASKFYAGIKADYNQESIAVKVAEVESELV